MKLSEMTIDQIKNLTLNELIQLDANFTIMHGFSFIDFKEGQLKAQITIKPVEYDQIPKSNDKRYPMIVKLRDELGFTQEEIARIMELSQPAISKIIKLYEPVGDVVHHQQT